jgi:hypothetical protein
MPNNVVLACLKGENVVCVSITTWFVLVVYVRAFAISSFILDR